MDDKIKKKILKDYKEAQRNIEKKFEGDPNFWVKSIKQYLHPTVVTSVCDSDDERGELNYYQVIRSTLEEILVKGYSKFTWHFNGAPEYIKSLLKK